jgi:phosphatidylglycerol:prolipoprotein diacylglycerol transferase
MGWVIIFIILSVYFKRRRHQGEVFGLLLLLYGLHRFGVEFLRGDTHAPGEFSVAQWISIAVFFVGLSIVAYCRNTPALMPSTETTSSSSAPQKGKRRKKNRKKK